MAVFSPGDVIKVPFPYVEMPVSRFRPALVVSSTELQERLGLVWVMMITSAKNRPWAGDVPVSDEASAGLPAPSVIRCAKIATIEAARADRIGQLNAADRKLVDRMLERAMARPL